MSSTEDPDLYTVKAEPLVENEDEIDTDPVTACESVVAFPIFTPVWFTWNSTVDPVTTVSEPVTVKLLVKLPDPETSNL